jgi:type II secretory pathway pseudopilin PulG
MRARLRDESGMGLIELLVAMVVLNIGLFAVISVFTGATAAMGRSATISAASAVADKQMEIYRSLKDCAIWLDASSFPAMGSSSMYEADTKSYTNLYATPATAVPYFNKGASQSAKEMSPWSTNFTTTTAIAGWTGDIPSSCTPSASTPPTAATQAWQKVNGPDGAAYFVYTYIILIQPTDSGGTYTGTYVKQVTITVRDPRNEAKILARQTQLFDPAMDTFQPNPP